MIGGPDGAYITIKWIAAGLVFGSAALAQSDVPPAGSNPFAHNPQAIAEGRQLFNRTCTVCHGIDGAAGGRGPALGGGRTYVVRTDQAIFEAILKGIPGSEMPASGLKVDETWKVVAFIRSLRNTASSSPVPGDVAHGEQVFWQKGHCGDCHMLQGRGAISGPDLSNVAGAQTLQYIRESLTKPRAKIPPGYQPVEVITKSGTKISGVAKNVDNFSIQLLDSHDQLQFFITDEISEMKFPKESGMPYNFDQVLTNSEFQDLLAFLSRQVTHIVRRRGDIE